MKQLAFSVFDSKARVFCKPFFVPTMEVALRAFQGAANDPSHEMGRHAEDFTLFQIGEFDDENGVLTPSAQHMNCGLAAHFKNKE